MARKSRSGSVARGPKVVRTKAPSAAARVSGAQFKQRPLAAARYRADIDGLRAIAVLAVLGYHAFPQQFQGGFSGVDVFFVISGYLISTNILLGLSGGQFSFKNFYARRVKRIFPALIFVLAACFVAGWFTLFPNEYKQLGKHIAGGAGFVSNFLFWKEAGYFDTTAELKPLLHLWSLGIEEQFYLAWPLLLYVAWRRRLPVVWGLAALIAASLLLNVHETHTDAVAAFYSPLGRFWELTIGSLLAYCALFRSALVLPRDYARSAAAAAGLLAVAGAIVYLNRARAFPGWWALLPTCGTALVIAAGPGTWISRNVLSNRALVYIGLISFPLYLWHWPILSFARIFASGEISGGLRVAALSSSFLLAALTYALVEKPIRYGAHGSTKVAILAALVLAIGAAGYVVFAEQGLTFRVASLLHTDTPTHEAKAAKLAAEYAGLNYDYQTDARWATCWLTPEGPEKYRPECVDPVVPGAAPKPLALVWGDSHAARLFPGIRNRLGDKFRLAQFTRSSCPPVLDFYEPLCRESNAFILRKITQLRPDVVILFARWLSYGTWTAGTEGPEKLKLTISALKSAGVKRIILIGPAPMWSPFLPQNMVRIYQKDVRHRLPARTTEGLDPGPSPVDAALAGQFGHRNDVVYVSALQAFCNEEGCLTRVNEEATGITTWDYGHLTTAAAEYFAARLPMTR